MPSKKNPLTNRKNNFITFLLILGIFIVTFLLVKQNDFTKNSLSSMTIVPGTTIPPTTDTPSPIPWLLPEEIAGYKVSCGKKSGLYDKTWDVGFVYNATLTDLECGTTYYCIITAYNSEGVQSSPSAETTYTTPPCDDKTITPPQAPSGLRILSMITASSLGFSTGDTILLSGGYVFGEYTNLAQSLNLIVPTDTPIELTALASPNSSFSHWTGCDSVLGNVCTMTAVDLKNVTAVFVPKTTYIITTSSRGTGKGTISGLTGTSQEFFDGSFVKLTATPTFGSTFVGWNGACTGSNTICTLTMNSNKDVTARFDAVVNGTCSKTINTCTAGTFVDANDTTTQYKWSCVGINGGTTSSCGINKPTYTVKAIKFGPGTILWGTSSFSGGVFPLGTTITLTAKPATGYRFYRWAGCTTVSGSTCTVSMNGSKTVTATFVKK